MRPILFMLSLLISLNAIGADVEYDYEQLVELNIIEITPLLDDLYIKLTDSECSVNLISALEQLIWMHHRRDELRPPNRRGWEYLTIMQLYAKLGYLYELAGEEAKSLHFYGVAMEYDDDPNQERFDLDYIRGVPYKSRMGCEIRSN